MQLRHCPAPVIGDEICSDSTVLREAKDGKAQRVGRSESQETDGRVIICSELSEGRGEGKNEEMDIDTLVLFMAINVGVSWAENPDRPEEEEEVSNTPLSERVKALEERLDRLDRVKTIKKVEEYLCPDGEIHDAPPPGGALS